MARDLEAGKKKAVEGLNLLLQRYASLPSRKLQCSSRAIIASGKFIRRAMLMKIVRPPWRNGMLGGLGRFEQL
jgi:hypothetical protein